MATAAAPAASALSLPLPPPFASFSLVAAARTRRPALPVLPASTAASAFALAPFYRSKVPSLLLTPNVGISLKPLRRRTAAAAPGDAVPSSEAIIDEAQKVVPAAADVGVTSSIVSVLLVIAFVGLSILTVGVIYIAVTDFLQKREREKFEKEEAAEKKKGGKKVKAKARAGPRGFGQKVEEIAEDD